MSLPSWDFEWLPRTSNVFNLAFAHFTVSRISEELSGKITLDIKVSADLEILLHPYEHAFFLILRSDGGWDKLFQGSLGVLDQKHILISAVASYPLLKTSHPLGLVSQLPLHVPLLKLLQQKRKALEYLRQISPPFRAPPGYLSQIRLTGEGFRHQHGRHLHNVDHKTLTVRRVH